VCFVLCALCESGIGSVSVGLSLSLSLSLSLCVLCVCARSVCGVCGAVHGVFAFEFALLPLDIKHISWCGHWQTQERPDIRIWQVNTRTCR
jgi:hypothetical protein